MVPQIKLGDLAVEVVLKDIKNVHLSVHPPAGRVQISAPSRMPLETIRLYAISKLPWIRVQQRKLREQQRESAREYLHRETHYLWGKRYLLDVMASESEPFIALKHGHIILCTRAGASRDARERLLSRWYREQVRAKALALAEAWAPRLGVIVRKVFVQEMKTKWGSCNPRAHTIRLNTELAKKPPDCLEYIMVHEMVHLLEPRHGKKFVHLMDRFLPRWHFVRDKLNRLPVRHEDWNY